MLRNCVRRSPDEALRAESGLAQHPGLCSISRITPQAATSGLLHLISGHGPINLTGPSGHPTCQIGYFQESMV